MDNPAGWALDDDGNLKDASAMTWTHSPSHEDQPLPTDNQSGRVLRSQRQYQTTLNHANKNKPPQLLGSLNKKKSKKRQRTASGWLGRSGCSKSSAASEENRGESESEADEMVDGEDSGDGNNADGDSEADEYNVASTNVSDGTILSDGEMSITVLDQEGYLALKRSKEENGRLSGRHRDSRTDDIRGVFSPGSRVIEEPDGSIRTVVGNICEICKAQGKPEDTYFLKGKVTAMRNHIARQEGHFKIYKRKCEQNNIKINEHAVPKAEKESHIQSTLNPDMFKPQVPIKWSKAGLLDHILELIVEDDNAIRMVERPSFRRILQYQRPQTAEKDIPHRTLLRQEIIGKGEEISIQAASRLAATPGQISITFDTWTSKAGDNYLSFTAHYIFYNDSDPTHWRLVNEVLALSHLEGGHSGINQANVLVNVISRFGIAHKVGWLTSDNATVNDRAVLHLQNHIENQTRRTGWKWKQRRIRCMEHATHLAARHFIEAISPTPASVVKRQLFAQQDGHEVLEDQGPVEEEDLINDFDPGDIVGKVLAFVTQVRKSPDARAFLRELCENVNIPALELATWVRTRWGSLYHCFGVVLKLRPAIDAFVRLADVSNRVPELKKKRYECYKFEREEWDLLTLMHDALKIPANAQMSFSADSHPSVNYAIPVLECLQTSWEDMLDDPKYLSIHHGLTAGLENLKKWYRKLDDTNVYFICLVLDPRMKLEYTREKWDKEWHDKGVEDLEALFDEYYTPPPDLQATPSSNETVSVSSPKKGAQWAVAWMQIAVQSRAQRERATMNPRQELRDYLDSRLELHCEDTVRWWGMNSKRYPTLARIACDYLGIQGSSVASERLFSAASLTGTNRRNRLKPEVFEAIQIAKSAFKNGFISCSQEASKREKRVWDDSMMDWLSESGPE